MRGVEFVDFEKINSLEGVFVANRFDSDHTHDFFFDQKFKGKEFTQEEVMANMADKMKRSQEASTNINKKQMKTKLSIQKDGDEFSAKDLEKNIKTFITHNKGGKWEVIKAPTEDSEGKKIDCYVEENCGLNL